MPDSVAMIANGMGFAHRTSAAGVTPKVWADIGEALTIAPPTPSRPSIDVTHLKSAGREFKPGLSDGGEVTVVLNHSPDARAKVDTLFLADGLQEFRITYPDDSTETFNGFVTGKATEGGEIDGKLTLNCPVKVSGVPVYAEAA